MACHVTEAVAILRSTAADHTDGVRTNYRRGIVWYHDVRMGDFKDGQMELTNNGAKFGTKFKKLME